MVVAKGVDVRPEDLAELKARPTRLAVELPSAPILGVHDRWTARLAEHLSLFRTEHVQGAFGARDQLG